MKPTEITYRLFDIVKEELTRKRYSRPREYQDFWLSVKTIDRHSYCFYHNGIITDLMDFKTLHQISSDFITLLTELKHTSVWRRLDWETMELAEGNDIVSYPCYIHINPSPCQEYTELVRFINSRSDTRIQETDLWSIGIIKSNGRTIETGSRSYPIHYRAHYCRSVLSLLESQFAPSDSLTVSFNTTDDINTTDRLTLTEEGHSITGERKRYGHIEIRTTNGHLKTHIDLNM